MAPSSSFSSFLPLFLVLVLSISSVFCIPEQIHIALTGSPTSMSVVWLTQANTTTSIVKYGTTSTHLALSVAGPPTTRYHVIWPTYDSPFIHEVILTHLATDTMYFYQVGDAIDGWSNTSYFMTEKTVPPSPTSPLNILVTADQGATGNSSNAIAAMLKLDQDNAYSMVLFSGDISYANLNSPIWDYWGNMVQPLANHVPIMFSVGNHELFDLFEAYQHRFRMPTDGVWGNLYYSFNYGPLHIIALDSESATFDHFALQFVWLQDDLAKVNRTATPWLVAMWHTPWYSSNTMHQGAAFHMRSEFEALLYKYHVDIVLNGHVHAYERTLPVYNGTVVSDGIIYMTDGNGGNGEGLYPNWLPTPAWSAYHESSYGFATMQIFNSTHLFWQMHRLNDSSIADEVWITHSLDFLN